DDKGKVTVTIPKDKNPGDKVTGKITVTYPDGSTEEVPVSVTVTNQDTETPSEIEITRKPNGDAIVTPKKPDG
ncbi:YPDG domain-containing protein, partial [Streptococcus mitis]|nr:YPDG domain-containing protein [Streptococcus mitis]